MARRTAQYVEYDDQGSSTFYTPGHVDGGSFNNDAAHEWEYAMGGVATPGLGLVDASGSVDFRPTDATFINKALRSTLTGQPSSLVFETGTDSEAYKHEYAKIASLSLSGAVNARLSASASWIAMTPSQIAVPSWGSRHSGDPFHWYQGTVTVSGGAYTMTEFSVEVNNNVRAFGSLDEASAGSLRHPEEVIAFQEEVSMTCTVNVPLGSNAMDVWDDAPPTGLVASLAFTSAAPTTLTIALANLTLTGWQKAYQVNDIVAWALTLTGQPNTADTIAISAA